MWRRRRRRGLQRLCRTNNLRGVLLRRGGCHGNCQCHTYIYNGGPHIHALLPPRTTPPPRVARQRRSAFARIAANSVGCLCCPNASNCIIARRAKLGIPPSPGATHELDCTVRDGSVNQVLTWQNWERAFCVCGETGPSRFLL